MKWLRPVALVVILGLVAFGWWAAERKEARRRDTLSGIIETRQIEIGSKTAGRVLKVRVREGDRVKKGQPVLEFDGDELRADLEAAEAAVANAQAQLDLLLAGTRSERIAQLRAAADAALSSYEKLRRGTRREDIEQAQAAYDQAVAGLKKLEAGSRPEEVAQAKAAYDSAEAEYRKVVKGPREEEIARAQAALRAAQAQRDKAEKEATRIGDLFAQGAVSQQQLDAVEAALETAREAEESAAQALQQLIRGSRPEDIEAARNRMEQARQALELARKGPRAEDIEAARQLVRQAKAALDLARNGPRPEDIEAARQRHLQANAALDEALSGARSEEIASAEAAVEQAKARLALARVRLREAVVNSPADGIIQKLNLRPGDLVAAGQPIASLQPDDDLWVDVYVPEDRLGVLRVGRKVRLRVDSYPGESFEGVVEFLSTQAEFTPRNVQTPEERVNKVFAVRVRLIDPKRRLRAGMSADVALSEVAPL
jgi:HlyD family secretion protein